MANTPQNEYGEDWRIEIGSGGDAETFAVFGGETGFDWKRNAANIDDSDKDGGSYGSGSFGQQTLTFSVTGNLKLPDVALARATAVAKQRPPHASVKVLRGAIVKYSGVCAIGPVSTTHKLNATVDYSFDLVNRGIPLVDDLGASA